MTVACPVCLSRTQCFTYPLQSQKEAPGCPRATGGFSSASRGRPERDGVGTRRSFPLRGRVKPPGVELRRQAGFGQRSPTLPGIPVPEHPDPGQASHVERRAGCLGTARGKAARAWAKTKTLLSASRIVFRAYRPHPQRSRPVGPSHFGPLGPKGCPAGTGMGNRTRPPPVSGPCLGALAAHPPRGIGSTVPARPPLGSSSGSPLWSDPRGMRPLAFRTRFSTRLALTLQGVPYPFGAHRRGGLPPVVVPRPPAGGNPRGKPVRAFLGAHRRRLRAPRGVRGPPRSHSPSYSPGLPLSLRPGGLLGGIFAGASGGCPPYAAGYSTRLTRGFVPPPQAVCARAERFPR